MSDQYMLTYSEEEGNNMEVETYDHLQHAIIRMLEVGEQYPWGFTASIIYDSQDEDGKLYDVVEFSDNRGFDFSLERLPLKGHKL
jgi:hypothetical protein